MTDGTAKLRRATWTSSRATTIRAIAFDHPPRTSGNSTRVRRKPCTKTATAIAASAIVHASSGQSRRPPNGDWSGGIPAGSALRARLLIPKLTLSLTHALTPTRPPRYCRPDVTLLTDVTSALELPGGSLALLCRPAAQGDGLHLRRGDGHIRLLLPPVQWRSGAQWPAEPGGGGGAVPEVPP